MARGGQRQLILDLGLFEWKRCGDDERWSERFVFDLLEMFARENMDVIRCARASGRPIPPLYAAGVRWIKEPPDREIFMSIPAVLRDKGADCEDLATWRVAELRDGGEPAGFVVKRWRYLGDLSKGSYDARRHRKGLGVWQCSELRTLGGAARRILFAHEGRVGPPPGDMDPRRMYHVLVQRAVLGPQGWVPSAVEDPSAALGMTSDRGGN